MKDGLVQNKLNNFWEGKINKIDFNILSNKILFSLEIIENKKVTLHEIEFINVSTYYFVNNSTDKRHAFIKEDYDDYLEMTSIYLIDSDTVINLESDKEKWLTQYCAKVNIALEIWSSLFLIEAEEIRIDSEYIKLI